MKSQLASDASFVLVDKPVGMTSQECVSLIKKTLQCVKVGHGGTLDPFATGALPVFFNDWTRLTSLFSFADKRYQAVLSLGKKTDTGDKTGAVIAKGPSAVANQVNCRLLERSLVGEITLPIPIYSALKVDGVPMHQLARSGQLTQPIKKRTTVLYSLKLEAINAETIGIDVECSHGTYIRSLGEHIAQKLKTQGHLTDLQRVSYSLKRSRKSLNVVSLKDFLAKPDDFIITEQQLSDYLPCYQLNRGLYRDFLIGKMRRFPNQDSGWFIVEQGSRFLGVVLLEEGKITQRVNIQRIKNIEPIFSEEQRLNLRRQES